MEPGSRRVTTESTPLWIEVPSSSSCQTCAYYNSPAICAGAAGPSLGIADKCSRPGPYSNQTSFGAPYKVRPPFAQPGTTRNTESPKIS